SNSRVSSARTVILPPSSTTRALRSRGRSPSRTSVRAWKRIGAPVAMSGAVTAGKAAAAAFRAAGDVVEGAGPVDAGAGGAGRDEIGAAGTISIGADNVAVFGTARAGARDVAKAGALGATAGRRKPAIARTVTTLPATTTAIAETASLARSFLGSTTVPPLPPPD